MNASQLVQGCRRQLTSSRFVVGSVIRERSNSASASAGVSSLSVSVSHPPRRNLNTSSSDSNNNNSNNSRSRSSRPPRPPRTPGGPAELPTLDASPFLDSTLYIKKSSTASQTIGGIEATKRLLSGQNQVRSWIWRKQNEIRAGSGSGSGRNSNSHSGGGGSADSGLRQQWREKKGVEFGLVGHGVPYQLLQDHVDTAWELLNDLGHIHVGSGSGGSEEKEVVECDFYNGNGWLDFDWIRIHRRDGEKLSHPINIQHTTSSSSSSSPPKFEINSHHIKLYLTVMRRMSNAFGTILIAGSKEHEHTSPSSSSSLSSSSTEHIQIDPEKYWKKLIPTPMRHWKATVKRGFVYPPSVTGTFSHFDVTLGWTGPPIVELIPGTSGGSGGSTSTTTSDSMSSSVPSIVRVTVQGIPTVFWDENQKNDCDEEEDREDHDRTNNSSTTTYRNDMVPVSLVFEACFEQPRDMIETID